MVPLLDSVDKFILCGLALSLILIGLWLKKRGRGARSPRIVIQWGIRLIVIAVIVVQMGWAVHQRHSDVFIKPLDGMFKTLLSYGSALQTWLASHPSEIARWGLIAVLLLTIAAYWRFREKTFPGLTLIYAITTGSLGWLWMQNNQMGQGALFLILSGIYALYARQPEKTTDLKTKFSSAPWSLLIIFLILLLGSWLRIYGINRIPFRFDFDEALYGIKAIDVLNGHNPTYLWENISWRGLGHTNLSPIYTYALSGYFLVFGANLVALKLLPITCGLLSILLIYSIGKILFNPKAGLLAAFFLAVSPIAINLSRCGLLLISTQTVGLLIIYLLLRAVLRRDRKAYCLLGLVLAFAGYMYSPIKQLMMVAGFILVVYILFKRKFLIQHWSGILLLIATLLISGIFLNIPVLDLIYPKIVDYESVWHRTSTHLYTPEPDYIRAIPLVFENFHRLLESLFINPHFNYDPWPRGNLYLNPALSVLSLVGLMIALGNWKQSRYRLLLFFLVVFVQPNLLSRPPVMTRRLLYFMPFLYLTASLPILSLWEEIRKTSVVWGKVLLSIVLVVFCAGVALQNAHIYFNSREHSGRWESERLFDEHVKQLLEDYYVFVSPYWPSYSPTTINFLCHEKVAPGTRSDYYRYISPGEVNNLINNTPERSVAFVLQPDSQGRTTARLIKEKLPHANIEEIIDTFGRPQAISCLIDYPPPPMED